MYDLMYFLLVSFPVVYCGLDSCHRN